MAGECFSAVLVVELIGLQFPPAPVAPADHLLVLVRIEDAVPRGAHAQPKRVVLVLVAAARARARAVLEHPRVPLALALLRARPRRVPGAQGVRGEPAQGVRGVQRLPEERRPCGCCPARAAQGGRPQIGPRARDGGRGGDLE